MSKLLKRIHPEVSVYKDRRFEGDEVDWQRALRTSTTLYIGNLSFYTREEQIYEVFSKVGHVERIVVGLDKVQKTPCGFAFVIFYTRQEAAAAVRYLNGTVLDERPIRVDHDWGFVDGRQWGRGSSGGQVRDEFRLDYDPGRGGFGKVVQQEIETHIMPGGGRMPPNLGSQPSPAQPSFKRQRMDGGGGGGGRPAETEDNPRFRERQRRRNDSDDDEDR